MALSKYNSTFPNVSCHLFDYSANSYQDHLLLEQEAVVHYLHTDITYPESC